MAGKGETVKYYIDADTSGFSRGMAEAAIESGVAGKTIQNNLGSTSKKAENNFKDIRRNAQTAASSIRNFGIAFQAFNTTSAIIGITALSGALLELGGALAAAGSTVSILTPLLFQGVAASQAFQAGVFGLSDAFKAIGKNDPKAFAKALANLGPAATSVAYAVGGLNKAMNGIRFNTQQALLQGMGATLLNLGAKILPTVNAGFQEIGQAMNRAFNIAAGLIGSPAFGGLLASVFADTAHNVDILSGALSPLLTIFTQLYGITAPYVSLLSQAIVNLTKAGAAYLSTRNGQIALNIAVAEGVIAIKELSDLVGAAFGFLTAVFRTAVASGNSLIITLTGIIRNMEAWVNSAKGQAQLVALFQFSSLAIQTVSTALGVALGFFFDIIQAVSSLNPAIQQMIVGFLASALTIRPIIAYFSQLYLAIRVLAVTIFNVIQQAIVVFGALGAVASIALILAGALIILGSVIKGPLGSALIVVGVAIASYIGLSYLLTLASNAAASAMVRQGAVSVALAGETELMAFTTNIAAVTMLGMAESAAAAGSGLSIAAAGAQILQAALLPLLVLAAGVLVILGMLGVFSSKSKAASGATTGLSGSLTSLQKSLKGVGSSGNKAATGGLSALNDSLNSVGDASAAAQGSLASFDKMNVLTNNSAAGAGIPGLPSLPDLGSLGGGGVAAPAIDTTDFDNSLADMTKNFDALKNNLGAGIPNPFDEIGKWINAHPWIALTAFVVILLAVAAAFVVLDVAAAPITLILGLIALAVVALVAIVVLLQEKFQLFTKIGQIVMTAIQPIVDIFTKYVWPIFQQIGNFIAGIFVAAWNQLVKVWNELMVALQPVLPVLKVIGAILLVALVAPLILVVAAIVAVIAIIGGLLYILGVVVQFLIDAVSWIVNAFNQVAKFFNDIGTAITNAVTAYYTFVANIFVTIVNVIVNAFQTAWNAIVSVWNAVVGFFQGVWNGIVLVFSVAVAFYTNVFKTAWTAIQSVWSAVVGWFQGVWNGIVAIFNAVGGFFSSIFTTAWNNVKAAFSAVTSFFQGIWNTITSIFGSIGTAIGDAIGGAFKGVVNTVLNAVSGIVNTVIDLINGAIDLINKIPGVHIGKVPRLTLPRLAKGGVVTSSTFAEIGENGAEAVMPLENNTGWIDKLAEKINSSNGGGNGQPIQFTVQIGEEKIATQMINLINEKTQMSGRNSILV